MKNEFIGVDEVRVHARAGAALSNCLKECVIMAFTEWRNVHLIHNDLEYLINPERILQALYCYEESSESMRSGALHNRTGIE